MTDTLTRLNNITTKIAEIAKMTESQKQEFFQNYSEGLITYLLVDGKDKVDPTVFANLEAATKTTPPNPTAVAKATHEFLADLENSEVGQQLLKNRFAEVIVSMVETIQSQIKPDQRAQLIQTLQANDLS